MIVLPSASTASWKDGYSADDGLAVRKSGPWAKEKHHYLTYYGRMFATSMKKKFANRVYMELFAGPGRCVFPDHKEGPGSPLQMMDSPFTQFVLIERNKTAAKALEVRLSKHPAASSTAVYCGDCAEAVTKVSLPASKCLALTFVDPTGISHCPFSLIQDLRARLRTDLLINFPHGMGLKMNKHQYTATAADKSIVTKFLNTDAWVEHLSEKPKDFARTALAIYKKQLESLDYHVGGREVVIHTTAGTPLYILLFASRDKLGVSFWDKTMKGVQQPEFDLH